MKRRTLLGGVAALVGAASWSLWQSREDEPTSYDTATSGTDGYGVEGYGTDGYGR